MRNLGHEAMAGTNIRESGESPRCPVEKLMSERGYLVLTFSEPRRIGEVINWWTTWERSFTHPVIVSAEATEKQLIEQANILYPESDNSDVSSDGFCYLVTTD